MAKKSKRKNQADSVVKKALLAIFRSFSIKSRLVLVTSLCVTLLIVVSLVFTYLTFVKDKKAYVFEQCYSFAENSLYQYKLQISEFLQDFRTSPESQKYLSFYERDGVINKSAGNMDYELETFSPKAFGVPRYPKRNETFLVYYRDRIHFLIAQKKEITIKTLVETKPTKRRRRRRKPQYTTETLQLNEITLVLYNKRSGGMESAAGKIVYVLNSSGDLIESNSSALTAAGTKISDRDIVMQYQQGGQTQGSRQYIDGGDDFIGIFMEVPKTNIAIFVEIPMGEATKSVTKVILQTVGVSLIIMLLTLVIIYFFVKWIVQPLNDIAAFSEEVAAGNYDVSISYFFRDELNELIVNFMTMVKNIQQREESLAEITEVANMDHLTKIYNNRYFKINSAKGLIDTAEQGCTSSFILLDVDKFKVFNDTYGHLQGDKVLIDVGATLHSCGGESDLVARYGGEEFVVYSHNVTPEYAIGLAEKLRVEVMKTKVDYLEKPGEFLSVQISLGVAITNGKNFANISEAIKAADEGLYYCKEHGRNMVSFWTPNGCKAVERTEDA